MKGATEVGRSMPWARPQAATVPPYLVMLSTLASVCAADRIDGAGPALLVERARRAGQLAAVDDLAAPRPFR